MDLQKEGIDEYSLFDTIIAYHSDFKKLGKFHYYENRVSKNILFSIPFEPIIHILGDWGNFTISKGG
jgi:hypothetical protein